MTLSTPPAAPAFSQPSEGLRADLTPAAVRLAIRAASDEGRTTDTVTPDEVASLRAALAGCDPIVFGAVARWAEAEGLSALLHRVWTTAPAPLASELADTASRVAERAAALAADRAALAAAFGEAGVPWRPLKGAWLADHAYLRASDRPMADVDVWVEPPHLPAAREALRALGYVQRASSWKHDVFARPDDRVVDVRGEHAANPRPVDVHARWIEGHRGLALDVGALALAAGRGWPDRAAMLVHVAAHATADALARRLRLLHVVDLAVLAARLAEDDWTALARMARSPHVARFVWPALDLARRAGAALPAEPCDELSRAVQPALHRWTAGVDLDAVTRAGGRGAPRALTEALRIWPLDPREATRVLRWILWPPRAALADRYPGLVASWRWPFAYVLHVRDSGRVAGRRWRQRAPDRRRRT